MGVDMEQVLADRALPGRPLPGRGDAHAVRARTPSRPCWPATAPRPSSWSRAATTTPGEAGWRRRPGRLPLQALLPRLRPRHGHADGLRRGYDRPLLHLRHHRLRGAHQPDDRLRGQADLEGSTGRCAGRWSTSTSSGRHGRRHRGSSFTVGHELVETVSGCPASLVGYGFVGFAGVQKMSSSAGGAPTARTPCGCRGADPAVALRSAQPQQTFNIDFGAEVVRLYDEWDLLGRKAAAAERAARHRGARPRAGRVRPRPRGCCRPRRVVEPFRLLSSVADVTAGSAELISVTVERAGHPTPVEDLEPGLDKARRRGQASPSGGPHDRPGVAGPRRRRRSTRSSASGSTCSWPTCPTNSTSSP